MSDNFGNVYEITECFIKVASFTEFTKKAMSTKRQMAGFKYCEKANDV